MGGTSRCSLLCLRVLICFGSEIMLCASCSASFLSFQKHSSVSLQLFQNSQHGCLLCHRNFPQQIKHPVYFSFSG